MARKLSVSVTYDAVSNASIIDGDTSDNGYIDPRTERRRTFRSKGQRYVKAAQRGRYDWPSLRAAIAFIDAQNCASHETSWTRSDDTLTIYASDAYETHSTDARPGELALSYALHITGATYGTLDRLARMLARNGVYFSNVPALVREATRARKAG
jgi:hypothetical protein